MNIDQTRFWSKVSRLGPDDCWLWTAATFNGRYGCFNVDGQAYLAHRVSFWLANGYLPDKPAVIRHCCNNKLCINPKHLCEGSYTDNKLDSSIGWNPSHSHLVLEAKRLREAGLSHKTIATKLGVSRSTIWRWEERGWSRNIVG